jgi:hypothetical protein
VRPSGRVAHRLGSSVERSDETEHEQSDVENLLLASGGAGLVMEHCGCERCQGVQRDERREARERGETNGSRSRGGHCDKSKEEGQHESDTKEERG